MKKTDLWSHEKMPVCLGVQESSENFGGISFQANSFSADLHHICNSSLSISSEPPGEWHLAYRLRRTCLLDAEATVQGML